MKHLKTFFACMLMAVLSIGQVWATDYELVYTLDGTNTSCGGSSAYDAAGNDVVQSDIHWAVVGNVTQNPWRIGGKSLSGVNRTVTSKTAISDDIAKIEIEHGTKTLTAVNSMTVEVASNSSFSTIVSSFNPTFEASKTVTILRPEGKDWSDCFYRITYNVDAGKSNSYLQLVSVKMYTEKAAPAFSITAQSNDNSKGTVSLSGSVITGSPKAGFRYASPAYSVSPANSATVSQNGNAFTVTPSANTTVIINFEAIPQYTVTWNNNGATSTSQVYEGAKPEFPATPAACDASSTTFIGWATAPWDGKIANLSEKTVYTSADAMPAVNGTATYYAVFAKSSGSASNLFSWAGGTKAELTAAEGVAALAADNSDYADTYAPYRVKWNGTGKYIIISVASQPGKVTAGFKMIGGATTSTITVQEADNAEGTFTDVEDLAISGSTNDEVEIETTQAFKSTTRAIKLYYTKGSNVGLGPISIEGAVSYADYMTTCCTQYNVNIAAGIENGSVSADVAKACEGATVTLTFTPAQNYHLSGWTLNGTAQDVAKNTFTMPNEAVTVSATFAQDACTPLTTPIVTVSGKAYPYNAVKLSWTAIEHADAYKVYIYDNEDNELEHNDAFTSVEYTVGQTLNGATTYKYSVQAISNTPATYCPSTAAESTFATDALPTAHLTLIDLSGTHASSGDYAILTPFALPTTAASCSKAFYGWTATQNYSSENVAPEYKAGDNFTFENTEGVTLYAVYASVVSAGTATWDEISTVPEAGEYAICSESYFMKASVTSSRFENGANTPDIENNQLKTAPASDCIWELSLNNEGKYLIKNGTNYAAGTGSNNQGKLVADATDTKAQWTIAYNSGFVIENVDNKAASKNAVLRNNTTYGWGCYGATTGLAPRLFKKNIGDPVYGNYSTTCQAQVATPVISGVTADGVYTEEKEISITCATSEATIYYAIDSDDEPTTQYTGAFTVSTNGAHTVKAKAVKADMADSEIASVSFTIELPLSTMDQIFAAATAAGGTATDVNIAFGNWVVSGVSTNGKNVYVTDGTKGFIIFDSGASMGFNVGDVLSGTVACKVQLYNGAAELTTLSSSTEGLNVATGGVITPTVKAISELSGINTGAAVTINSVQFDGEYLSDGANSIKPYNSLFAYDALTEDTYYNVTGIYQQFDATKEILPRSAADIEEVSLSDPEISYTPASATIELGEELPGTTFANPHELTISYSSNNESVATVNATGVITLGSATGTAVITASFAGDATYAPANVTYTITVNPASVSQNVVILAVYDTKYYAMSTTNASSAFTAIAVEYDGEKVTVNSADDKAAIQWTKKTSGDNTTFQDADSKYMKSADGTSMSLQDAVCNWIWDEGEFYKISGTSRTFFYQNGTGFKNFATSNFNKSGYSDKAQVIVIAPENIVLNTKVDPQLAYDPTSVTLTVGQTFTPATLTYADGFDGLAAVTYESSNTDLATVEGGVVSLVADATGTATITATFAGNNNYQAGSASYTITVNEAGDDLSGTWVLATAVPEIGEKFIVAGTYNNVTKTMGIQNANNRAAVESSLSEGVLTPGEGTKVFTLVDAGEGKFAIQASNGKYLTASGTGTKNYLTEADDYEAANAKWTISISEGIASVVASSSNRNQMQYNKSNPGLFSCYDGGQTAIQLYVLQSATVVTKYTVTYAANGGSGDVPEAVEYEEGETFAVAAADLFTAPEGKEFDKWNDGKNDYAPDDIYTVGTADVVLTAIWKDAPSVDPDPQPEFVTLRSGLSVGEFGTYCPKQRVEAYAGATFFKFAYMQFVNETPLKAYFDELAEGEALVAGHPYFYITNAETITGVKTGEEVGDGNNDRGFIGKVNTFEFQVTPSNEYYDRVYVVYQNKIMRCSNGYYRLGAEKAYIDIKDPNLAKTKEEAPVLTPGRRRVGINNNEAPQVATGLDGVSSNAQAMKVIINDQLFIIRGDKMYNTTGRFVGNVQ